MNLFNGIVAEIKLKIWQIKFSGSVYPNYGILQNRLRIHREGIFTSCGVYLDSGYFMDL
jgi:hypothetical protein